MLVLLPIDAPINEAIIDNAHPPQITIQSEPLQKVGSTMEEIMPIILHNTGT